ncbi:MAG: hypothetical protein P8P83_00205 [Rickettsiaceae bacterium]|nr:hypothetical protein [Rickettsiaceae bacterium]
MTKIFQSQFKKFKEKAEDFGVNEETALKIKNMHIIHSKSLRQVAEKQLKASLLESGNKTLESLAGGIKANTEEKSLVTVIQHTVKHILKDPKNPLHNIEDKFIAQMQDMTSGHKKKLVKSIGTVVGKENIETLEDKLFNQANQVWNNLAQELDIMLVGFIEKTKDHLNDFLEASSSESESSSDESSDEDIVVNEASPAVEEVAEAAADETVPAVEEAVSEEAAEPTTVEEAEAAAEEAAEACYD